jgi:hypothetical protein
MRIDRLLIVGLLALLIGCRESRRTGICPPIQGATRVVLNLGDGRPPHVITDPGRILQLTAYTNARRDVIPPVRRPPPLPRMTMSFYQGNQFLCSIGDGPDFFFIGCPSWTGIHPASSNELQDFERMVTQTASGITSGTAGGNRSATTGSTAGPTASATAGATTGASK